MEKIYRRNLRAASAAAPRVPYQGHRAEFRSGDLIAQSHGDWNSWSGIQVIGVRAFTLSTYSHVGVVWVDPVDGHVYVYEAVRPFVHRVRLSTIGAFYHLPMQALWTSETSRFADKCVGTPYSRWRAIEAYFHPLPAGTVNECAALCREIMIRAGVDLGVLSRPDTVVQAALATGSLLTYVANGETSNDK